VGGILVLIAYFAAAFGYRIHVEEAVLTSKLGDEYVAYAKRTKRLVPWFFEHFMHLFSFCTEPRGESY
jgi:protein-S-isoprenylcysteine O-methyltransferase Ste14